MASRSRETLHAAVARVAAAPAMVLRRAGAEPLAPDVRADAEARLGHDFSRVRVHTDVDGAERMGALAFTLGDHIAFAPGRYAPHTPDGDRLLDHELAHVVERAPVVGFQVDTSVLPGFDQGDYGSCGAASIVTALVLWDREDRGQGGPGSLVVTACDIALVYLDDRRKELIKKWDQQLPNGGEHVHELLVRTTTEIRDAAREPGAGLTQAQFEEIGVVFYALHRGGGTGMARHAREQLLRMLGLTAESSDTISSFDAVFTAPSITGLRPSRVAQVSWYVIRGSSTDQPGKMRLGAHAFLIGRLQNDGTWFLSDQGTSPATELRAPTLEELKGRALALNRYWTGAPPHTVVFGHEVPVPEGQNQVLLLGERAGVRARAANLVMTPGEELAEIDADWLTLGDTVRAGDLVTRAYSEAEGLAALAAIPAGRGGVMVENPVGLFHVHETTPVSDANVTQIAIDGRGSTGALLDPARGRYYSAWLRLSSTAAAGKPFQVY